MSGRPGASVRAREPSPSAARSGGPASAVTAAPVHGTSDGPRLAFWNDRLPTFDAVVIGGGVQGACIYHHLARAGHRVLLVDRGDFGGGTSQASAMLVWGGLLYLRSAASTREVCRLSAARDALLREHRSWTEPHTLRYVLPRNGGRRPAKAQSALWLYWLLGGCRRRPPRRDRSFAEAAFLRRPAATESLLFEEGRLRCSDAGFVLRWVFTARANGSRAMNYCEARPDGREPGGWRLTLADTLGAATRQVRAAWVVNAAGVWADAVNDSFGVRSPLRHAFSKGVSLAFARHPAHRDTLVFDNRSGEDALSLVPWGPVSLWGSTETLIDDPRHGFEASGDELRYLLDELNRHRSASLEPRDVISVRSGVRPLAVGADWTGGGDPLRLSRRHRVWTDRHRRWVSVYGGKITDCVSLARQVAALLPTSHGTRACEPRGHVALSPAPLERFAGLEAPVPSPAWCRDHVQCRTLDDYLRRRTNIAQWVPRAGLGRRGEFEPDLRRIARAFSANDAAAARCVEDYARRTRAGPVPAGGGVTGAASSPGAEESAVLAAEALS